MTIVNTQIRENRYTKHYSRHRSAQSTSSSPNTHLSDVLARTTNNETITLENTRNRDMSRTEYHECVEADTIVRRVFA